MLSKFVPSDLVRLTRIYSFSFRSTYLSISAAILDLSVPRTLMALRHLGRLDDRRLYKPRSENIELGTQRHRHGWRRQSE